MAPDVLRRRRQSCARLPAGSAGFSLAPSGHSEPGGLATADSGSSSSEADLLRGAGERQRAHRAPRRGRVAWLIRRLEHYNAMRYSESVIRSFRSRETERIWRGEVSRRLPSEIQAPARRKLRMLNNAQTVHDLRVPPGNRLESLKGDRAGQFSIRINQRWRICFEWQDDDAHAVEIVDYHRG